MAGASEDAQCSALLPLCCKGWDCLDGQMVPKG